MLNPTNSPIPRSTKTHPDALMCLLWQMEHPILRLVEAKSFYKSQLEALLKSPEILLYPVCFRSKMKKWWITSWFAGFIVIGDWLVSSTTPGWSSPLPVLRFCAQRAPTIDFFKDVFAGWMPYPWCFHSFWEVHHLANSQLRFHAFHVWGQMVRAAYFSWNELPLSSEDARGVMFVVRVNKPILMVSIEFFPFATSHRTHLGSGCVWNLSLLHVSSRLEVGSGWFRVGFSAGDTTKDRGLKKHWCGHWWFAGVLIEMQFIVMSTFVPFVACGKDAKQALVQASCLGALQPL